MAKYDIPGKEYKRDYFVYFYTFLLHMYSTMFLCHPYHSLQNQHCM